MSGEAGYTHFTVLTNNGLGKNSRQACVFSSASANGFSEPHGSVRAPFAMKIRKTETDNSVCNDEIQNRVVTTDLYWVVLRCMGFFRRLCKIVKVTISVVISLCLPDRPSVLMSAPT
jgi:hypothetical protein